MALFTIYVASILFIDNHLSCSCGGIIEELSPRKHVLFNSACVVLSGMAILMARKQDATIRFNWLTRGSTVALFLLVGWTLCSAFSAPLTIKTGMEGRLLPSFDLLLTDSVTHLNTADIPSGKPIIVIGFSPTCGHCGAETEEIVKHISQLKDTRIYFLSSASITQMRGFTATSNWGNTLTSIWGEIPTIRS